MDVLIGVRRNPKQGEKLTRCQRGLNVVPIAGREARNSSACGWPDCSVIIPATARERHSRLRTWRAYMKMSVMAAFGRFAPSRGQQSMRHASRALATSVPATPERMPKVVSFVG
jgi:hypothetical protein